MEKQKQYRVGNGFDVHQFKQGDEVIICGVKVPHSHSLKGHSDADVGLHSITDALLGAIGEGDIGEHFSDKDDKWKNCDSAVFLTFAKNLIAKKQGEIINVDITIICEEPKLKNYKKSMQIRVAEILQITEDRVNVKATTTEKLGFLGRSEGIASLTTASVLI